MPSHSNRYNKTAADKASKAEKRKMRSQPASNPQKKMRKADSFNILNFRSDTRTEIIDEKGNAVPLKTAAVLDSRKLTLHNEVKVEFSYADIENDRPITITDHSDNGSPLKGITPGRTKMYRAEKGSFLNIFTSSEALANNAVGTPLRELPLNTNFLESSAFKAVRENPDDCSTHSILIDAAQLNKVKNELARTGSSRNQNQVMKNAGKNVSKATANYYANAADVNEANVTWEWLHKIAFRFLGREGQVPENLGCGTAHANTDMLIIESALPQLTDLIPEGFLLTVTAQYVKSTKILTKIDYVVTIDGNEFKATFNGQRQSKPLKVGYDYHSSFFKQLAGSKQIDTEDLASEFPELAITPKKHPSPVA